MNQEKSHQCQSCKQNLPAVCYYPSQIARQENQRRCKECMKKATKDWYQRNKDNPLRKSINERRKAEVRENLRKHKYGITPVEFQSLLESQNNVCAICGNPESKTIRGYKCELSVDHCHNSQKVRGLLCASCNVGIGFFQDNLDLLEKAIAYLKSNP